VDTPPSVVVDPASRGAITQRSNGLVFLTQQSQLLARLAELARAVSADVPGLRIDMRYTAPPSELSTEPGASALFDEARMLRLEQLRARGLAEIDSPYESPPSGPSTSTSSAARRAHGVKGLPRE
jgi:hypothetical protein